LQQQQQRRVDRLHVAATRARYLDALGFLCPAPYPVVVEQEKYLRVSGASTKMLGTRREGRVVVGGEKRF
jgi:hypothetical protein